MAINPENLAKVRIGIDVGGTFTHAVAIDGETLDIIGKAKVPTTHKAQEGVAKGIIDSLQSLLDKANISPTSVGFIAHSTTQATNALLEGDVAPVGLLAMGKGINAFFARMASHIGKIELAPGKFLTTYYQFIDSTKEPSQEQIETAIKNLVSQGAKAIAISEAFSVDDPSCEEKALTIAKNMGLPATSGSEVSQLYGLKIRTRTAVINASMLPKMIESANMTEDSVRKAGISAPIMIMRSDGGVMDIDAMRKRPILTMLSGPAAGVAAAMMYLHISDGIFLEVGGTSTDISAIRNGKALVKAAEIGGHRVYLRTLDVRTVGVAGGSMVRLTKGNITDVGPRSAHIAGLGYISFAPELSNLAIELIQPLAQDPKDYLQLVSGSDGNKQLYCLTPTCASNFLDLVPKGDCAQGKLENIKLGFAALAKHTGKKEEELATSLLSIATAKCIPIVNQLMKDYKLDPELTTLVGGGGGAAAIVPFTANSMRLKHYMANNADVISAIGVALALVRETVERQIIHPTNDDILRIRQEAFESVRKMGAEAATIEVQVEIDNKTNTVRATACGATNAGNSAGTKKTLNSEDKLKLVSESMRTTPEHVTALGQSHFFDAYGSSIKHKFMAGLLGGTKHQIRILDNHGSIRLQSKNGIVRCVKANEVTSTIDILCEEFAQWGDAGKVIPNFLLLAGSKIIDLSGVLDQSQVTALAKIETDSLASDSVVMILANID